MTGPVDQGQTLRYRHSVRDSAGVLANAGTVAITITLPDLTIATPTVVNSSTGLYDIAYTTTQVGLHNLKGSATGGVLGTETDVWSDAFTVQEPNRMFIGVDEASNHLRAGGIITSDDDREKLRWLCEVASDAVERDLGRPITRRSFTETYNGGKSVIKLYQAPVISITSVTELGSSVASTGYSLWAEAGLLRRGTTRSAATWAGDWQSVAVTYVAGFANPPTCVRYAALGSVQESWQESQQASHSILNSFNAESAIALGAPSGLVEININAYRALKAHGFGG